MEGVLLTPLKRIATPRGDVLHGMKRDDPGYAGYGEAYFSRVLPGAIKGWKRHRRMTLNLIVPLGHIRFLIHDDRTDQFQDVELSPDSDALYRRLTVPPGLWLAFRGEGSSISTLLNIASIPHEPDEAENLPLESFAWSWS